MRPTRPDDGPGPSADFPSPTESPAKAGATFNPFTLRRVDSSYSLTRASFASQLAQLSSLQIPQASSLKSSISAIPRATEAARALKDAAEQIRKWIDKAAQVLTDLDAEDDVEWAAAGGREGLGEVDQAVTRFDGLIRVYVDAIEELQAREDADSVPPGELTTVVTQMEKTFEEWEKIRRMLKNVKEQVELAMEWEELLNVVLGDIGMEIEDLGRLVFEMEEARHRSLAGEANGDASHGIDIGELETIAEETPPAGSMGEGRHGRNGFSIPHISKGSPLQSPGLVVTHDDSSLLALFARMQPLRASLDFLPMRLSTFHSRARRIFPTACDELDDRRESLELDWRDLERDADSLRRELGEDRWVLVFRNAGRQAQKMCESVSRSVSRVREAIEGGSQHINPSSLAKKVESYEAKKTHYGPAIERVLAIIERGVSDRLTINGEIIRLRSEADAQWKVLAREIKETDAHLEALHLGKDQQLRDSISTILSLDQSAAEGSVHTPGSSPASSVGMSGANGRTDATVGPSATKSRAHRLSALPRPSGDRRNFTMPATAPSTTAATPRAPATPAATSRVASPSRTIRRSSATPTLHTYKSRSSLAGTDNKPRWNSSVSTKDSPIGHNFKPLTLTTPSPHRKTLGDESRRERSYSPAQPTPATHLPLPMRDRLASPSPARLSIGPYETPRPRLRNHASTSQMSSSRTGRPSNLTPRHVSHGDSVNEQTPTAAPPARPASAMASGRRSSLLPMPKAPPSATRNASGRASVAMTFKDRMAAIPSTARPPSQARMSMSMSVGPGTSRPESRGGSRVRGGDTGKERPAWR
ncbi:MAG: hypothetical protein M1838_005841 [Thelocarpon superellum]|nr:MAG: hypothetical protein M1838_005841 [Thelocarpon superellum]